MPEEPPLRAWTFLRRQSAIGLLLLLAACSVTGDQPPLDDGAVPATKQQAAYLTLINSNQIQFERTDDGSLEVVCRCGPKIYTTDIPITLKQAVVAIEDKRFNDHHGIDPLAWGRAIGRAITAPDENYEGASTLTQQLVKNAILYADRDPFRKRREMAIAIELEKVLSKDEILVAFLNQTIFGQTGARPIVGAEQAARHFFGRAAIELSLYESAVLAGLLKGPTIYNPNKYPERSRARAKLVLEAMLEQGFITRKEFTNALKERRRRGPRRPIKFEYRHFTDWVISEIGAERPDIEFNEYVRIPLTLETISQAKAESSLVAATQRFAPHQEVSFVTMAYDGRVVVMVGSRDYGTRQFNLATQAKRQPASSFKAFIYLAAIEERVVRPSRWLTRAFARSDNEVAQSLTRLVGPDKVAAVARRLGIRSPLREDQSLALGTSELSLTELTGAYAAFASRGFRATPYGYYGVVESGYALHWPDRQRGPRVIERGPVDEMRKLLRAVVLYGTGKPAAIVPGVRGKTGTSDENRDAWFIGFNSRNVSGLWIGNPDNSPMRGVSGSVASSVWAETVRSLPTE